MGQPWASSLCVTVQFATPVTGFVIEFVIGNICTVAELVRGSGQPAVQIACDAGSVHIGMDARVLTCARTHAVNGNVCAR